MSDTNQPLNFKYSEPTDGPEEYYANHIQVFWTGIDITLIFGELTHSTENLAKSVLGVQNRAKVTMPWSMAKLVMANLADAIAKYEKKNGPVKLPGEYQLP